MKKTALVFIISLILFLSIAFIVVTAVKSLIKADQEISKISLAYEELSATRLALRLAIIYQRDFIITSDNNHFDRYKLQKEIIYRELESLQKTNVKNAVLNADSLNLLSDLIYDKINHLDTIIGLKKQNYPIREIELKIEGSDTQALDIIRKVSEDLQAILEKKNADFRNSTSKNSYRIILIVVFGFLIGFILLVYSFISLLLEIKARIKIEKELKRKSQQLKETILTKDRFFHILAHDLRNPFNALMGINDLIINRMKEKDHSLFELGKESQSVAKNTFNLLQNLLEWARVQTGELKSQPEKFNVKDLITENIDLYQQAAKGKEITINENCNDNLVVFADRNMCSTVIRNLINNAIKFSFQDSFIEIRVEKLADKVNIFVKDNGVGISEQNVKNLFSLDHKIQTKGTAEEKGTGLGLILCKDLAEKMGGEISVKSELNSGTEFSFSIPV